MLPFDDYPEGGRQLLRGVKGANCRREYGLQFMKLTGQTTCAYCGLDFAASYENWLQMALDHVVPTSVCDKLSVPKEWKNDCSNMVLACAACNGFDNRYRQPVDKECPQSLEAFYQLRDRIFAARKCRIAKRHKSEREFFERRLWEQRR